MHREECGGLRLSWMATEEVTPTGEKAAVALGVSFEEEEEEEEESEEAGAGLATPCRRRSRSVVATPPPDHPPSIIHEQGFTDGEAPSKPSSAGKRAGSVVGRWP